jgi:lipoic acid synthetase
MSNYGKPSWIKKKYSPLDNNRIKQILTDIDLHTVCEQACCPNIGECFAKGTATFLILGKICTRNCHFCAVEQGIPVSPDEEEPHGVAIAVKRMGIRYVVITSVTRDDLADGGASHFAKTIEAIYSMDQGIKVEVLIPDLQGKKTLLAEILKAQPAVLSHNIETVPRLYSKVRPQADFERSIHLLKASKKMNPRVPVKSGLMLGLGETDDEVFDLLNDLREAECDYLTIGQYLQPRPDLLPVVRYVHPGEFESYRLKGLEMGFKSVASGPFVRSSYNAQQLYENDV